MKNIFTAKYKEVFVGVVMTAFALFYLASTINIKKLNGVGVGAEFMPRLYGTVVLILGIMQIYFSSKKLNFFKESEEGENISDTKNAMLSFILIIVYFGIMNFIGFIISSILFLFGLSSLLTPKSKKKNLFVTIIFSVVLPILCFYFFKSVMHLALPIGIIFGGW